MLWSPTGPTVLATTDPALAERFVPLSSLNLGGVARVWAELAGSFTIGDENVLNTYEIPVGIGQDLFIAYGPETHISASAGPIFITPGIARP